MSVNLVLNISLDLLSKYLFVKVLKRSRVITKGECYNITLYYYGCVYSKLRKQVYFVITITITDSPNKLNVYS